MKQRILVSLLAILMAGCGLPLSHGGTPVRTPVASTDVALLMPTPTAAPGLSGAEIASLQEYACAVVPVVNELNTASLRYQQAKLAVSAQLIDTARLDMKDAIFYSGQAQSQLNALEPPYALAGYQGLLSRAADQYQAGGQALRGDYASNRLASADKDARPFYAGDRALNRAEQIRSRVSDRVSLPDESSPRCTKAYLLKFLHHQGHFNSPAVPKIGSHRTSSPKPAAQPARAVAPTPTQPARPVPTRTVGTPPVRLQPPPRAGMSAAERAYITSASSVISQVYSAAADLNQAGQLLSKQQNAETTPLIDQAVVILHRAHAAGNRLRAPSRADARAQRNLILAVAQAYTASRKLRITEIDLAGENRQDAQADFRQADLVLRRALGSAAAAMRALQARENAT